MKKYQLFYLIAFCSFFSFITFNSQTAEAKPPKYIFYVIGDGMGPNQILLSQIFHSEVNGKIGTEALSFTNFPSMTLASSYSTTSSITCSAAAGTALASGKKTSVGTIGMNADHTKPLLSIAHYAKKVGMKVGITTSVSIDHATPASFFAHQPDRNMYYQIGFDAIKSDFDLYAGSGFLQNKNPKNESAPALMPALESAGYTIAKGYKDFKNKMNNSKKIVFIQEEGKPNVSLPFAIDREANDLTLPQIVEGSIEFLSKNSGKKGFFLMIEGGKIDWSSHANDGATTLREVDDLSETLKKVLDFYEKHKDETLIVITADHETGGLALGKKGYALNLKALDHQKVSKGKLSQIFVDLSKEKEGKVSWEEVKDVLRKQLGFWDKVQINPAQEGKLFECYQTSFIQKKDVKEKTMYASTGAMATLAVSMLNEIALIGWSTTAHSGAAVPVYSTGVGSQNFTGFMDNTDIPKRIAKLIGIEL